jgi:hypothetical protein
MTVVALLSPIDRSLLLYDVCNPAEVSFVFLSNKGDMLAAVALTLTLVLALGNTGKLVPC